MSLGAGRRVDAAFKLLEVPIKGWIRARVRSGSSALESVADLSQILTAGQSVLTARRVSLPGCLR